MTSTNTHGAGLGRLFTSAAVLALLLFTAGAADAQTRIFVDGNDGRDSNSGANANPATTGSAGPVLTLDRAFEIARQSNDANIISIEAGTYDLNEDIGDDTNEFNLAFEARVNPNGGSVVVLDLNGGEFDIAPEDTNPPSAGSRRSFAFTSAATNGGTFRIEDGDIDFENGNIDIGTGVVELDVDEVEVSRAAVTGTPDYDGLPSQFTFDGNGTVSGGVAFNPSGQILPAVIDANGSDIDIFVGSGIQLRNVDVQLEDDGAEVELTNNGTIIGDIAVRDGNGTAGTAVLFDGSGFYGNVSVGSSADLVFDDNASTGDFTQTGGTVTAPGFRGTLTVNGDFDQSGGDFDNDFILALRGTSDTTFDPGANLVLQGLRVFSAPGSSRTVSLAAGNTFDIIGAGGTLNDADFVVGAATTFDANGGAVSLLGDAAGGGGVAIVDGDFVDGELQFLGADENNDDDPNNDVFEGSSLLSGTGDIESIRLDRNVNLSPTADLNFDGTLFLIDGSLIVDDAQIFNDANGNGQIDPGEFLGEITGDISPEGPDAAVVIDITNAIPNAGGFLSAATPRIIEDDTDGDFIRDSGFNDENNAYDLTYVDDRPNTFDQGIVGEEFVFSNIRDLTLDLQNGEVIISDQSFGGFFPPGNSAGQAGLTAFDVGVIQGDLTILDGRRRGGPGDGVDADNDVDVARLVIEDVFGLLAGDLLIEDDAELLLSFDGAFALLSDNNVVNGTITGPGQLILSDATLIGGGDVAGNEAQLDPFLIGIYNPFTGTNNSDATIRGFDAIGSTSGGFLFDASDEGGSLTVDLLGDNQGRPGSPERAGNINFGFNLNDTELILNSPVHVTDPTSFHNVQILNTSGTSGDEANTFFLEGPTALTLGGDVVGLGSVWPATGQLVNGDVNGDGVVDINDGDLDGDGDVDADDAVIGNARFNLFDTNGDGFINGADQIAGDLNRDGQVNATDQAQYDLVASVAAPFDVVNADDIDAIRDALDMNGNAIRDGDLDGDGDVDAIDQAIYDIADVDNDGDVDNDDGARVDDADASPRDGFFDGPNAGNPDADIDRDGDIDNDDALIFNTYDINGIQGIQGGDTDVFEEADDNPADGNVDTTGDLNGDGFVNATDDAIIDAADISGPSGDPDGDIGADDILAFAQADTNGDGDIDALGSGDVDGDGDFDGDDVLILNRARAGVTGNNLINIFAQQGIDSITIPTFHPGDEPTDITRLNEDVIVTNLLRITGVLDVETADNQPNEPGADVDYSLTLADGATLVLDNGYTVLRDSESGGNSGDPDDEIIFAGAFDLVTNEQGTVNPFTTFDAFASGQIRTATINGTSGFPEVVGGNGLPQVSFDLVNVVVSPGAQYDLNGHIFRVSGDLTLNGDDDIINSQPDLERAVAATETGLAASSRVGAEPFSEIAFVGADSSRINAPTGTLLGDGVDIRINKAAGAVVALTSGSLLFDDEFDGTPSTSTDADNDETLFLESGIFVVGDPSNQQSVYVRLDHENTPLLTEDVDGGQGFVIVGAEGQDQSIALTDSYVAGNVRKRVANVGTATPGRVIYPTGEMDDNDDDDRDYAPFVFDFESNGAGATFGLRSINVTFVDENPGVNSSLPTADVPAIEAVPDFYWLVSTTGSALGQGTTFNVEARADDFVIVNNIDNLELIRRQDGSVAGNPYVNVGGGASTFTVDPDGQEDGDLGDDFVVIQESGIDSFLGPQGTIVTFGLTANQRPVSNEGDNASALPTEFALNGTFPNPFSARAELSFDLPEAATVTLEVYDVMGRQVMNVNTGGLNAGADQRIAIDGSSLASGVYVYRLRAAGATDTWTRSGQITLAR